jgi:hypothetical protein
VVPSADIKIFQGNEQDKRTMNYKNERFFGVDVEIDGNRFENCRFARCNLVYRGGDSPALIGCDFQDVEIIFGNSAANTVALMQEMYAAGFAQVIEKTINYIRGNPFPGSESFR